MIELQSESLVPNSIRAVLGFSLLYLLAATAVAISNGNYEFILYVVVMAILIAGVAVVHLRVGFSAGVLWALSLWGLAHMAGGLVPVPAGWPIDGTIPVLYSWWLIPGYLKYDHVVHAYGFGVTAWVCWEGLRSIVSGITNRPGASIRPTAGMLILCGAAALGFGALNELVEFAATLLVPQTNVGGYVNTGWDLVSNTVGVVISSGLIWSTQRN